VKATRKFDQLEERAVMTSFLLQDKEGKKRKKKVARMSGPNARISAPKNSGLLSESSRKWTEKASRVNTRYLVATLCRSYTGALLIV